MKKHVPKILLILVLLLLAAGAVLLVRQRKAELSGMETASQPALPVQVRRVEKGTVEQTRHYLGIIEPVVSASVAARVTGRLEAVYVDTGDTVEKNQLVAEIDDRLLKQDLSVLQADLNGAEADLADLKQRYDRRKDLFKKGHVNEESMEAARSAFVSARSRVSRLRASIESARISLGYAKIRAPFNGVVTGRTKDPGDLVMPGQAVCRIEDPDQGYKILVTLDSQTARAASGPAAARIIHGSGILAAEIDRIHPAADENRLAVAEIRIKEPPFDLPSMTAVGVDLVFPGIEALVVPRRAALEYDGQWRVFVLRDNQRTKPVKVSVAGFGKDRIAVIADVLKAGDQVVVGDESMLIRLGAHTRVAPIKPGAGRETR